MRTPIVTFDRCPGSIVEPRQAGSLSEVDEDSLRRRATAMVATTLRAAGVPASGISFERTYVVASWLLLQVADVLSSILTLPDWAPKLVFYVLVIGLVPAILLAWAFELTSQGVRRERSSSDEHAAVDKGFPAVLIGLDIPGNVAG